MPFTLKENALSRMLSQRDKVSYYTINRDWFLGFVEAEGGFFGEKGKPAIFECSQHSSDYFLMCAIKEWFGAGTVKIVPRRDGRISSVYTLRGKELSNTLLPLFRGAPCTPKMKRSFIPWCKAHFPDYNSNIIDHSLIISQDWLAEFTDGDGSFYTTIRQQEDYRIGFQFQAVFDLSQKIDSSGRSSLLHLISHQYFSERPKALIKTIGADQMDRLRITSAKYLQQRCIPLFQGRLQSRKEIQIALFQDAVQYILDGQHLKPENRSAIGAFIKRCKEWSNRHSLECKKECNSFLAKRTKNKCLLGLIFD